MSVCSRSNWNLDVLVFEERGKLEHTEKNLLEETQLTWRRCQDSNPGHIGGRQVFSPWRHTCFTSKKHHPRDCLVAFSLDYTWELHFTQLSILKHIDSGGKGFGQARSRTPPPLQDSSNEFIVQKLNSVVVAATSIKLKSVYLHNEQCIFLITPLYWPWLKNLWMDKISLKTLTLNTRKLTW